ncbi:GntR family transcriptional regulator [Cuneatibacter sp. NSJ-177]|jgi:DNA-binding GntR family transcriptional regulator|uniref:GntR family transcriptional regulator n=1 Tax=Cuneatibacter sp. NSJ-177 TaxID=2931401 RepID=UPI001FD1D88D|nr:GntR family transcriptional regulator [Cuneatibacter sp. NSJ-177]MCJ7834737.1 GntR family transcriptional regulator [Cuneatibacter sp. NSJ-177]
MSEFQKLKEKREKTSCAELAYQSIRSLILNGEIKENDLVSENQIAAYLNMSRTPVREAVRRLEAERVLEVRKGSGTFLKPLTLKDIRNLFEVREHMEMLAAETALKHISDQDIQDLEEKLNAMLEDFRHGIKIEEARFSQTDGEIHDMLIDRSENGYVKYLMDQIYFNVDRYRAISYAVSLDLEESTNQHLELLECMKKRDQEELQRMIRAHIRWSYQVLQEKLIQL